MSWGMVYWLPWRELDRDRVEAAARAVAASLPGASLEVTARHGSATCLFRLPLSIVRELEPLPDDLDRRAADFGGRVGPLAVQIDFERADEDWPRGSGTFCYFEFDTARPDNGLCSGAATEITARLGKEFGVPGRPSWEAYT